MALGDDIKAQVESVRETLGTACSLNGTAITKKCSYAELSTQQMKEYLGDDFQDEINLPWAMIECPAGTGVKEQDKLTVTLTGQDWVVRRVSHPQAAGVKIGERCLCIGQLKQ